MVEFKTLHIALGDTQRRGMVALRRVSFGIRLPTQWCSACPIGRPDAISTLTNPICIPNKGAPAAGWFLMVLGEYLSEGILSNSQSLHSCVGVSHRQSPSRPFLLHVIPWTFGEITGLRWGDAPGVLRAVRRRIRNEDSCVRSRRFTGFPSRYWGYP